MTRTPCGRLLFGTVWGCWIVSLTPGAAPPARAQDEEGLMLSFQVEKGQKQTVEISKSVKGKMTVTDESGKRELKFVKTLDESYEEEVLDAQDNMIRKVQRKYTTSV
ncbi:MAG: hypothetical protein HYY93_06515, partial [Planctomycetes bacterium]|nr:hypothetical protein [Planctomycetota bacterium]